MSADKNPSPYAHTGWIKHDGKGMPINSSERVDVRTRGLDNYGFFDAVEYHDHDGSSWWEHNGSRRDIIEYRLNPRGAANPSPQPWEPATSPTLPVGGSDE